MNKNTRISVHTPVGVTEEEDTGEGLGQGTLEGAIVSAVNLDNGVNDSFGDSEYEVSYGDLRLQFFIRMMYPGCPWTSSLLRWVTTGWRQWWIRSC